MFISARFLHDFVLFVLFRTKRQKVRINGNRADFVQKSCARIVLIYNKISLVSEPKARLHKKRVPIWKGAIFILDFNRNIK
jgi:hypothetical protein